MRKSIFIFTAVLTILIGTVFCSAAPTVIGTMSEADGATKLHVSISENPGLAAWSVQLSWDQNAMKLEDVTCGQSFANGTFLKNDTKPGKLTVVWCNATDVSANADLFEVTFTPTGTAGKSSAVNLTYSAADTVNENGERVALKIGSMNTDPQKTAAEKPIAASKPEQQAPETATEPRISAFEDVRESDYFFEPVNWAVKNGVTGGVSAKRFAPEQPCSRAQAVTFLWRAMGSPEPKSVSIPFSDVEAGSYYSKAVLWATENGITAGTGKDTFSPDDTVTRGQLVTFLWRSAGKPEAAGKNTFSDVRETDFFAVSVCWAVGREITKGTSQNSFSPDAPCTRAQTVTFLYRYSIGGETQ